MMLQGIAAAPGVALGNLLLLEEQKLQINKTNIAPGDVGLEIERLEASLTQAITEIEGICEKTRQKLGDDKAAIFEAHIMLLKDPEYVGGIKQKIETENINAEAAVEVVTEEFLRVFASIDDEYIRERALDLKDVSERLLKSLLGVQSDSLTAKMENIILVAPDLTPSDTAQLDCDQFVGFAIDCGGRTSHSAIMARSMEIPAVVGLKDITKKVATGDFVIIDGNKGLVFINPTGEQIQEYQKIKDQVDANKKEFKKMANEPSITQDGIQVELAANIGNLQDAKAALANGAEGIGLFRTEFLYMGRDSFPSEDEQFEAYKAVALMFDDKPVVIRTLDIGGDKKLPYLNLPDEMNPFLGYRAVRLCLDCEHIFRTQLRAVLRASAYGKIKIMYPMIATLRELRQANKILTEVKQELARENIRFNDTLEVGIMVEIPATAILADQFAKEVDFFSIGTNDLVQYTMAADRMNEKVAYLSQPFNPAVLRLIQGVISAAHEEGKWVGMCGEMAGEPTAIPILLGMGLDEFSMSASSILSARALIRNLSKEKSLSVIENVMMLDNAEDIKSFVEEAFPQAALAR